MLKQTPSQTIGPFFGFCLISEGCNVLPNERTRGERIVLRGHVFDGSRTPVDDALVEIWQADAQGVFAHPADPRRDSADESFRGFGRCDTSNASREYHFETIRPGRVPWEGQRMQAPHINMRVFARGMLLHLTTRAYFSDENANERDPVLESIPDPARRRTLIAIRQNDTGPAIYRLDIHLQGDAETVFFDP